MGKYDTAEQTGGLDFYGAAEDSPHMARERQEIERRELLGVIADARALWAVRVLDAWQELNPGAHAFATPIKLGGSGWKCVSFSYPRVFVGATPDAARLAAAEAVYPTLPADVRAKLGVRPY